MEDNFKSLYEAALVLHKSGLGKRYKTPEDLLRVMLIGETIGKNPYQAAEYLAIVDDKIVIPGKVAKAVLFASGKLTRFDEEVTDTGTTVTLARGEDSITVSYTKKDAVDAGLWVTEAMVIEYPELRKSYWFNYPSDMMYWKAWGRAINSLFPDIVSFHVAETMDSRMEKKEKTVSQAQKKTADVVKETMAHLDAVKERKSIPVPEKEPEQEVEELQEEVVEPLPEKEIEKPWHPTNIEDINEGYLASLRKAAPVAEILDYFGIDYEPLIAGKSVTNKLLRTIFVDVKETYLANKIAKMEGREEKETKRPTVQLEEEDPIDNSAKEVEEYLDKRDISIYVHDDISGLEIPPFDAVKDSKQYRSNSAAQPLYMDILSLDYDEDKIDEYLHHINGEHKDLSELLTFGTEEEIVSVLKETK